MDKTILFTLLHDAWGEGSNESLRLSMMRLTDDALAEGDAQKREDIVYLEKLPVFNADGTVKG